MEKSGTGTFGQSKSITVNVVNTQRDAKIVDWDVPATVGAGVPIPVDIEVENTGTDT